MSIVDLVIIYLAFGAPLAVYKYLHVRDLSTRSRILSSVLTLLFWIPSAIRLVHRYLTNAFPTHVFVSSEDLDSPEPGRLVDLQETIRSELVGAGSSVPSYEIREVVGRFVGLAAAGENHPSDLRGVSFDLFRAAGREDQDLAIACLMRRNRRRMDRHHTRARREFVALFGDPSATDMTKAERAIKAAIELAALLEDRKAIDGLTALITQIEDQIWNPADRQLVPGNVPTGVPALRMKTARLSSD